MITDVPQIKISGINYPIYGVDYSWGGADSPSKVTVSIVNAKGIYKKPELGTKNVAKISLGTFFSFRGYPVAYTESNSVKGDILSITYLDTSVILDKIFVGLKGLHGSPPPLLKGMVKDNTHVYGSFDTQSILLLGEYVDPCEGISNELLDPCDPCVDQTEYISLGESNSQQVVNCATARLTQILDVIYSFQDLIAGLRSKGIVFKNTPIVKTNYYARYTGSARDVLRSWCSDLGFTFYWEDDAVVFVDLKGGITINDTSFYLDCSLLESSTSESIEGNSSIGNIVYFGAEGRIEKYDCAGKDYKLSLIPITLKDIFWAEGREGPALQPYIKKYYTLPKTGETSIEGLQVACALSYHSQMLRDMVLLYEFYQVTNISSLSGRKFPLLGMEILETWDVKTDGGSAGTVLKETMKEEFYKLPSSITEAATRYGASMCKIKFDGVKYQKFIEFERKLASDFMGRYWISFFSKGEQFNYSGPDGSPNYYDAGTPITLPFIDVIPQSSIATSNFLQLIINDSAAVNKDSGHVGDVTTTTPNSFAHSFLLMDRPASWEPSKIKEDIIKFEEMYGNRYFLKVDPFKLEGGADDFAEDEYYALIFDRPEIFEFVDGSTANHPIEQANVNRVVDIGGYTTSYGLRSAESKRYAVVVGEKGSDTIKGWSDALTIFLPPQSHDTFGVDFPGYAIIASKNSNSENHSTVVVERKEVIFGDVRQQNPQSTALIVNFKDLSSFIQNIIEESGGSCGYNITAIKQLISDYYVNTTRDKEVVKISKSYSIKGFPTRELKLRDGLSSLSIRYSSESGVSTDVEFSNSPPITKSENLQDLEAEKSILKKIIKRKFVTSQDKVIL